MSVDFYLSIYPTYQSYQCLKKPRVKELEHWIVFWQLFWGLYFFDCVIDKTAGVWSWIPLSQLVWNFYAMTRFGFLLANYHPNVAYFTHNTILKFMYKEADKLWKDLKTNGIKFKINQIKKRLYAQNFSEILPRMRSYFYQTHSWFFRQFVVTN